MLYRPVCQAVFAGCAVVILLLCGSGSATAQPTDVNASARGFYLDDGFNTEFYDGYNTGWEGVEYRSYFVFDIPTFSEEVTSATLRLWMPADSFLSPEASETISLWSVSTSVASLVSSHNPGAEGLAIFEDLGGGTNFGSATISDPGPGGSYLFISLNQDALDAIVAAQGSQLAIGGALANLAKTNSEIGFLNTATPDDEPTTGPTAARLTVVPEPNVAVLFGLSMGVVLYLVSRRKLVAGR